VRENVFDAGGEFLHGPVMTRFHKQQAAPHLRATSVVACAARYYWIGSFGRTGDAFSPAIAIPSITSRAISSQKFPTGVSAYFLRV
jgi:hypothetical protein